MAIDMSPVVTAVNGAVAPVAAVGLAVLLIVVAWKLYRWVLSAIDDYANADEFQDGDDVSEWYDRGGAFVCEQCDYELDEDEAITAFDHGHCPKCGNEVV